MLPKELEDIFDEYTEDDYNLCVTKVDYSTTDFIFDFVLNVQAINEKEEIKQSWTVVAIEPRRNNIVFDYEPFIKIENKHPLLWEFQDTQCQLYYSGQCRDIAKLFYDLYHTHKETFGNYNDFNISFGERTWDIKQFSYTNGLLAEGSKTLMLKYGDCLKRNGLNYTIIGELPAKYWNGQEWIVENGDVKILFFGKGFVIAKDFVFVQQDKNSK